MESLSEINLPNQLLSIAVTAGLVAFLFMILRILFNTFKLVGRKLQAKQFNKDNNLKD